MRFTQSQIILVLVCVTLTIASLLYTPNSIEPFSRKKIRRAAKRAAKRASDRAKRAAEQAAKKIAKEAAKLAEQLRIDKALKGLFTSITKLGGSFNKISKSLKNT